MEKHSFRELPTNCLGVFYKKIKQMIKIIVDHLGTDSTDERYFDESEIGEDNHWDGRIWDFDKFKYRLVQDKRLFKFYYHFTDIEGGQ